MPKGTPAKAHLVLDRGSYNIGKIIDDNNLKWLLLAMCVLTVLIRLSVYNRLVDTTETPIERPKKTKVLLLRKKEKT